MGWNKTIGLQHSPWSTLYRHVRQNTTHWGGKSGEKYLQKPARTFSLHPVLGMTVQLREALTGREWQIQSSNINADLIIGRRRSSIVTPSTLHLLWNVSRMKTFPFCFLNYAILKQTSVKKTNDCRSDGNLKINDPSLKLDSWEITESCSCGEKNEFYF